jgi:hypothetical protein
VWNLTGQNQARPSNEEIKALNNYVDFTNESIHGLLIVHRLLENFNKNINKYVDLPENIVNLYSNKDLPQDIFDDPEKWFYDLSPNELFKKIESSRQILPANVDARLYQSASSMKNITNAINNLRFEIDQLIPTLDLTKRENLSLVYDKLEEGVTYYKEFYRHQTDLENTISEYVKTFKQTDDDLQFPAVLKELQNVYKTQKNALVALYFRQDDDFDNLFNLQKEALRKFESIKLSDYNSTRLVNSKVQTYWSNIKKQSAASLNMQKSFINYEEIPEEYKIYERFYYFYNIAVINKFNRYGNGVVYEMNRILDYLEIPMVHFFEMPHYFKVIYPKILDSTEYLASSDPNIKRTPEAVRDRQVKIADRVIYVDSAVVEFRLFDNKIIDNDIVTINFNGDWIIEKYRLSEKPYMFKLALNKIGKNFLLLHAEDVGRQPPCTIALSYFYRGVLQNIFLNSDYNSSELIEIIIQE